MLTVLNVHNDHGLNLIKVSIVKDVNLFLINKDIKWIKRNLAKIRNFLRDCLMIVRRKMRKNVP